MITYSVAKVNLSKKTQKQSYSNLPRLGVHIFQKRQFFKQSLQDASLYYSHSLAPTVHHSFISRQSPPKTHTDDGEKRQLYEPSSFVLSISPSNITTSKQCFFLYIDGPTLLQTKLPSNAKNSSQSMRTHSGKITSPLRKTFCRPREHLPAR